MVRKRTTAKRVPANAKYPWDVWFGRRSFTLERGSHFDCLPHGMAQQVRNAAAARRKRVSVTIKQDVIWVEVVS